MGNVTAVRPRYVSTKPYTRPTGSTTRRDYSEGIGLAIARPGVPVLVAEEPYERQGAVAGSLHWVVERLNRVYPHTFAYTTRRHGDVVRGLIWVEK